MTTMLTAPAAVALDEITPLADMSVAQIVALPPAQLEASYCNLLTLQSRVKGVLDRFHAALDQRYTVQAAATRQANGRDFGVCHLTDGPLRITVELPKRVHWNQAQLADIATRIAAAGDKVGDYIDTDYSIPESRFNAWPAPLKETFAKARTVKPGKTDYRIALTDAEGGV